MKNKFNETGTDFGNTHNNVPESKYQFSEIQAFHNEQEFDLRKIKYPLATREIIKELLVLVNSETEYKLLLKELAELDVIIALQSLPMKGGAQEQLKMAKIVTIKGDPVIEIYESFDGSYWFITEKLYKQNTVLNDRIYRNDQILFGYARLSACPEFAEFGNISETELRLVGAWKVPQRNWSICPEVEVVDKQAATGEEIKASQPLKLNSNKCKEVLI